MTDSRAQDKDLRCTDCGEMFTWTARDQAFYQEKGLSQPKRCRFCRQERQQKRKRDALLEAQNGELR